MAYFLYLNSKNEGKLINKKIKDGFVEIEGKAFLVDTSDPIIIKRNLVAPIPFYIVKWDRTEPSSNLNPTTKVKIDKMKKLKRIIPDFEKERYDITPEMLRKMMGLKILGNMIKTKTGMGGMVLIIIGIIGGALIMYSMIAFGLLG